MADPIPDAWLPKVRVDRIVLHWTAGHHNPSDGDRAHYHLLYAGDGRRIRGLFSIAANSVGKLKSGQYAAHTRGCNSYAVGMSVGCMAGATQEPLNYGPSPMTREQFDAMCRDAAQICQHYSIPVDPKHVLWHAEVQGTLGIQQAGKWDATVLPFYPTLKGAKAVGDYTRGVIQSFKAGKRPVAPTPIVQVSPPPFNLGPLPSPQAPAGGIVDTPMAETAGPAKEGSGGRVGLWLAGLFAVGVTGGAVWYWNPLGLW